MKNFKTLAIAAVAMFATSNAFAETLPAVNDKAIFDMKPGQEVYQVKAGDEFDFPIMWLAQKQMYVGEFHMYFDTNVLDFVTGQKGITYDRGPAFADTDIITANSLKLTYYGGNKANNEFVVLLVNSSPDEDWGLLEIQDGYTPFITMKMKVAEDVAAGDYKVDFKKVQFCWDEIVDGKATIHPYVADDFSCIVRVGSTDGVDNIVADQDANAGKYFDLMGREVVKPAKGIYVQDGKKVYVK